MRRFQASQWPPRLLLNRILCSHLLRSSSSTRTSPSAFSHNNNNLSRLVFRWNVHQNTPHHFRRPAMLFCLMGMVPRDAANRRQGRAAITVYWALLMALLDYCSFAFNVFFSTRRCCEGRKDGWWNSGYYYRYFTEYEIIIQLGGYYYAVVVIGFIAFYLVFSLTLLPFSYSSDLHFISTLSSLLWCVGWYLLGDRVFLHGYWKKWKEIIIIKLREKK